MLLPLSTGVLDLKLNNVLYTFIHIPPNYSGPLGGHLGSAEQSVNTTFVILWPYEVGMVNVHVFTHPAVMK